MLGDATFFETPHEYVYCSCGVFLFSPGIAADLCFRPGARSRQSDIVFRLPLILTGIHCNEFTLNSNVDIDYYIACKSRLL